jgi:N utilization substance protein B
MKSQTPKPETLNSKDMKPETMKFNIDLEDLEASKPEGSDLIEGLPSKVVGIKSRRKAREAALQVLFQCESISDWSAASIHSYFERFHDLEIATLGAREGALRFCLELIEGVVLHGTEIDQIINNASDNWPIERMAQVDRNILRLACFEFCFMSDVPQSVTINEAIELAKIFSSDESLKFINGVLNRIVNNSEVQQRYPAFEARSSTAA